MDLGPWSGWASAAVATLSIAWTIAVAFAAAWRNRRIAAYSVVVVRSNGGEHPNQDWTVHNYGDYPIIGVELRDASEEEIEPVADFIAPKSSENFTISPLNNRLVYLKYRDARGLVWEKRFDSDWELPKRKRAYVERAKRRWVVVKARFRR